MRISRTISVSLLILLLASASSEAARLSVLYGGGSSGNNKTYTRVFVTSTTYDGNLGGISGADAKCQARADAASLGGTWKAIISDSTVNAISRQMNRLKPVFTITGKLAWNPSQQIVLGGDQAAAYGSGNMPFGHNFIASPINVTEFGASPGSWSVWTNSGNGSNSGNHCTNWTSNSSGVSAYYGNASSNGSIWIHQGTQTCNNTHRLYCLEDE